MTFRKWLERYAFQEGIEKVDLVMARINAAGAKSRRNWWEVFAGGPNGEPCVRWGVTFPVLRAAQIRQGKPVTLNAIILADDEEIPPVVATNRWRRRRLPSKSRSIANRSTKRARKNVS